LIGRIAAGAPIEAIEDANPEFVGNSLPDGCYALRVYGTSMIDDHIDDGDIVIVLPNPSPDDGAVVVAIIQDDTEFGGATLKRFYRTPDSRIRLQPRNHSVEPLVLPAKRVSIRGQVVRIIRDFL
jgi:repressor LexA